MADRRRRQPDRSRPLTTPVWFRILTRASRRHGLPSSARHLEGRALTKSQVDRRLTTVLAADVVGYTRLMGRDEDGTLARLKAHRKELFDPLIAEYHGRTVKLMGDGALVRVRKRRRRGAVRRPDPARLGRARARPSPRPIGSGFGSASISATSFSRRWRHLRRRREHRRPPASSSRSPAACWCPARPTIICRASSTSRSTPIGEQRVKNVERPVRAYRVRLNGAADPCTEQAGSMAPARARRRGSSLTALARSAMVADVGPAVDCRESRRSPCCHSRMSAAQAERRVLRGRRDRRPDHRSRQTFRALS